MKIIRTLLCASILVATPMIYSADQCQVAAKPTSPKQRTEFDQKKEQADNEAVAKLLTCDAQTMRAKFKQNEISQAVCDAALLEAAKVGKQPETVRILLEARANPEFAEDGMHPLLASAQAGSPKIIELLLDTRDIEATMVGQTAAHLKEKQSKQNNGETEEIQQLFGKYPGKQTALFDQQLAELLKKEKNVEVADLLKLAKIFTGQPKLALQRFLGTLEDRRSNPPDAETAQWLKNLDQINASLSSLNSIMYNCPKQNALLILARELTDDSFSEEEELEEL